MNFMFLKIFNSEFSNIEVVFTDQNSQPLGIKDAKKTQKKRCSKSEKQQEQQVI